MLNTDKIKGGINAGWREITNTSLKPADDKVVVLGWS